MIVKMIIIHLADLHFVKKRKGKTILKSLNVDKNHFFGINNTP